MLALIFANARGFGASSIKKRVRSTKCDATVIIAETLEKEISLLFWLVEDFFISTLVCGPQWHKVDRIGPKWIKTLLLGFLGLRFLKGKAVVTSSREFPGDGG